jgi:hypothetical protein
LARVSSGELGRDGTPFGEHQRWVEVISYARPWSAMVELVVVVHPFVRDDNRGPVVGVGRVIDLVRPVPDEL